MSRGSLALAIMDGLQHLQPPSRVEQGYADGARGAPAASEHADYYVGWRRGCLQRRARNGDVVIAFAMASQCQQCGATATGTYDSCPEGCDETSARVSILFGTLGVHQQPEGDDDLVFLSNRALRELLRTGTPVVDRDGNDLSDRVLMQ